LNAALPRQITSNCAIADDPLGLTRIFDPEIQLAQWRRPADPVIADWLAAHANDLGSGLRQTLAPGLQPDLSRLPAGAGGNALAVDIALLAEISANARAATSTIASKWSARPCVRACMSTASASGCLHLSRSGNGMGRRCFR
jgi:hypothetical protein